MNESSVPGTAHPTLKITLQNLNPTTSHLLHYNPTTCQGHVSRYPEAMKWTRDWRGRQYFPCPLSPPYLIILPHISQLVWPKFMMQYILSNRQRNIWYMCFWSLISIHTIHIIFSQPCGPPIALENSWIYLYVFLIFWEISCSNSS